MACHSTKPGQHQEKRPGETGGPRRLHAVLAPDQPHHGACRDRRRQLDGERIPLGRATGTRVGDGLVQKPREGEVVFRRKVLHELGQPGDDRDPRAERQQVDFRRPQLAPGHVRSLAIVALRRRIVGQASQSNGWRAPRLRRGNCRNCRDPSDFTTDAGVRLASGNEVDSPGGRAVRLASGA